MVQRPPVGFEDDVGDEVLALGIRLHAVRPGNSRWHRTGIVLNPERAEIVSPLDDSVRMRDGQVAAAPRPRSPTYITLSR